jgi:type IV secretion system protein VirB4
VVNIRQLLKDWESAPPFCEYIDIEKFIDDNFFRTKSGQVGCVLSVRGVDYESVTRQHLDSITTRLERTLQLFEPGTRVYQYFLRSSRPVIPHRHYDSAVSETIIGYRLDDLESKRDQLYETRTYLAVLVDMPATQAGVGGMFTGLLTRFSSHKTIAFSLMAQEAARAKLMQQVSIFAASTDDFATVALLDAAGAYSLFRQLLNPDPLTRLAPMVDGAAEWPGYFAADSTFRAHATHLELDNYFVRVLTLKALPNHTNPNMLKQLLRVRGNYHIVSSWTPERQQETIKQADTIIGHNDATKQRTTFTPKRQLGPSRVRKSKEAISDVLENVGTEIAVNNKHFGHYSLTVVVYDQDYDELEQVVSSFFNASQSIGLTLIAETDFANLAFLATFPGAHRYNLRAKRISESNHADLSFFYSLDTGDKFNKFLNDEYLALFTTRNSEPFYFNVHRGEVGHMSIIGPTGMGKSFLCNYLLGQASKYNPYITIIDLGGSYKYLTSLLDGNYTNFSSVEREFRLNPFRLENTPANLDFLATFVCLLIEEGGGSSIDDKQKDDVFKKISQLYAIDDPGLRTLTTLSRTLPETLSDRLSRWLRGGQYGYIFDNPSGEDTLTMSRVQTFNFEGFDDKSDFLQPLLFYILHKTSEVIGDDSLLSTLKIFHLDESFTFFKSKAIREYVESALLKWRKRNAVIWFATQGAGHLSKTDLLEDVVNNCSTKLFLANPSLDVDSYQSIFKMTRETADLIQTLEPRKEILSLQDPDPRRRGATDKTAKVIRLEVSARERWLYANSSDENVLRTEAFERFHGDLTMTLDYLVAHPTAKARA